jgi:hypothetical protein
MVASLAVKLDSSDLRLVVMMVVEKVVMMVEMMVVEKVDHLVASLVVY